MKLFDRRGFAHPHIFVPLLALIGCWFMYKSFTQNRLQQDLTEMFADVSNAAGKVVTSPQDRAAIESKIGEIKAIVGKYKDQAAPYYNGRGGTFGSYYNK